ncbi:phosphate ABC transporter permease subunit PstC [Haladaptatus sp. CMSO5]|uniref:phosphate ABC transporter permease subunit PstC n=1 Tax=Haladaptatus sp. CMSO5 TaxID=3120514 RepID=UPI003FA55A7C
MSTDYQSSDMTTRVANSPRERLIRWFFFACATVSVLTTLGIILALVGDAARFFRITGTTLMGIAPEQTVTFTQFFLGETWAPAITPIQFGVLPLIAGTLTVMIGSAIVALPLGLATAIYLSEYASPSVRSVLKPLLEVLAGVPTVVYGIFALIYITPALKTFIPQLGTFNALSASLMVGIMIIPMVSSISEDAMSAVPDSLRQAGYGLGATKFDVSTGIVIPAAISGIASSFILALSRAIGETMIVVVAAGATPKLVNPLLPGAYLESIQTMTAAMIQLGVGDIAAQGPAYRSLFAIGLTLFVITLAMNFISNLIAQHYRESYE